MSAERMLKVCPKCGFGNDDSRLYCSECGSILRDDQDKKEEKTIYDPDFIRNHKKLQREVFLILLICVFIPVSCVLASGIFVHICSFETEDNTIRILDLKAEDALQTTNQSCGSDPNRFEIGEEMILITHISGPAIDWSKIIKITIGFIGEDMLHQLKVINLKGSSFSLSNCQTNPGDTLTLGLNDTSKVYSGNYGVVRIIGSNMQWVSPREGFVVV